MISHRFYKDSSISFENIPGFLVHKENDDVFRNLILFLNKTDHLSLTVHNGDNFKQQQTSLLYRVVEFPLYSSNIHFFSEINLFSYTLQVVTSNCGRLGRLVQRRVDLAPNLEQGTTDRQADRQTKNKRFD